VVVAGSTGLVGREVIRQLAERSDVALAALVRRPGSLAGFVGAAQDGSGSREVVFDFDDPTAYERIGSEIPCDVLLCCVGSTLRAAGSKAAFLKVEHDIPVRFVERLQRACPRTIFAFVSSIGAHRPSGFYLRNKADVERVVRESGLAYVIARPSVLLGERRELRPAERVATLVMPPVFSFLAALTLKRSTFVELYAPVRASRVAAALIREAVDAQPPRAEILAGHALV
jgi:uncharacterized protein YbjT (DUF2867 family)